MTTPEVVSPVIRSRIVTTSTSTPRLRLLLLLTTLPYRWLCRRRHALPEGRPAIAATVYVPGDFHRNWPADCRSRRPAALRDAMVVDEHRFSRRRGSRKECPEEVSDICRSKGPSPNHLILHYVMPYKPYTPIAGPAASSMTSNYSRLQACCFDDKPL